MEGPEESLSRSAARGSFTLFAAGSATLVGSLVTQIALGWLLSDNDFGVYALAIGFSTFLLVFKDGGVRLWLLQQTREGFHSEVGNAFWLSLSLSVVTALALVGTSPLIANLYGEPALVWVIVVLAVATPLGTYPKIALAWLLVDLRFATHARIEIVSATLRYALMIGLALLGFGPLSFVLPVIAVNLFEGAACWATTRLRPWSAAFSLRGSQQIFSRSRWPLSGSFAAAALRQSDYVALGLVAATNVVGIYFFAYQLTFRVLALFAESLRKVIVPVFAAASDPERRRAAAVRGATFLGLVAAPFLLLIAVVAAPLEQILWQGRWDAAVPVIQILAAILPLQLLVLFLEMLTQSQGKFRLWTATLSFRGFGLAGAALLSGILADDNPTTVAAGIACYLALSGLIAIVVLSERLGISSLSMLRASMPPYLLAGLIGLLTVVLGERVHDLGTLSELGILALSYLATVILGGALFMRSRLRSILPIVRQLPIWK